MSFKFFSSFFPISSDHFPPLFSSLPCQAAGSISWQLGDSSEVQQATDGELHAIPRLHAHPCDYIPRLGQTAAKHDSHHGKTSLLVQIPVASKVNVINNYQ